MIRYPTVFVVLCRCLNCGRLNYVESPGTLAPCVCQKAAPQEPVRVELMTWKTIPDPAVDKYTKEVK